MVILHLFRNYSSGDIIVAHFDHGIRENSALDAEFVRQKALEYGCKFYLGQAKLGNHASEATARESRYNFLRKLARELGDNGQPAKILTAHHLDDLAETMAINLIRGTGWRGLAGLDTTGILRPFLEPDFFAQVHPGQTIWNKHDILRYAGEYQIRFREDQSNSSDEYLRNRIRHQMNNLVDLERVYQLWQRQKKIKKMIDEAVSHLIPEADSEWQRSWFKQLDDDIPSHQVALELLRAGTLRADIATTRPQLEDLRQAILNYAPGKSFNLPGGRLLRLDKHSFKL